MLRNILLKNNLVFNSRINLENQKILTSSIYNKINFNIINYTRNNFSEFNSQNVSKGKINQMKNRTNDFNKRNYNDDYEKRYSSKRQYDNFPNKSYYNRNLNRNDSKYHNYSSNPKRDNYRDNDSMIKFNKTIESSLDSKDKFRNREEARKESAIARKIIDNPDVQIKITEDDLHAAIAKTSELPEDTLKRLVEEYKIFVEEEEKSKGDNKEKDNEDLKTNALNLKKKENSLINNKFLNDLEIQINNSITKKLKVFLNKSLVNIAKIAKKNPDLFKNNKNFWIGLENEIMERSESLTNEQITDIVCAFVKSDVAEINIFEDIEDLIIETTIPFSPDQIERIFNSYCSKDKGTTSFLKHVTKKYMKNIDILDSWKVVKFITDLHNHPHSIKGDFGHVKELESLIVKDIENRKVKFENLVQIANCIFTNNLCSNKIQLLVENEIIDKIADFNRIDFDVGKFIKLIKSLNGYYIKNEELCDKIKNVLETYLNAYMKLQEENFNENEKRNNYQKWDTNMINENTINQDSQINKRKINLNKQIYKKQINEENKDNINFNENSQEETKEKLNFNDKNKTNKRIENDEEEPEIIVEKLNENELEELNMKTKMKKNRTINYEFMERYNKIMSNISMIFWSLSKNEKFKSLKNTREDYKYFFSRMKEMTLNNIEFYNEREITFILKAFRDLKIPLSKIDNKKFAIIISKLENFTLHDRVTLLGLFLRNDMAGSLESILNFIEKINENFKSLTYSDMIEFLELIDLVPNLINKILKENNNEKINFIEKRFSKIVQNIEIDKFCKLYLLSGKFNNYFTVGFLENINKILYNRINEIPKDYFCKILFNTINFSSHSVSTKLFDILEDLSHFENIRENFIKFDDLNYLLWSCLNFSKLKTSELYALEDNNTINNLGEKLINFSKSLTNNLIGIDNLTFIEETGNIQLVLNEKIFDDSIETISKEEHIIKFYKNLNEKIIIFINENFNLNKIENEVNNDNSSNQNVISDKNKKVYIYFQTIQLLLLFIKNNLYYNFKSENLIKINKNIIDINLHNYENKNKLNDILKEKFVELQEKVLSIISESSIKSDVTYLDNFVLTDAASLNDKDLCEDILKNVDQFFSKKPNCSIYQNLIDDYFNAINISIVFELPTLEKDEYVEGIDANKYAIIFINENYFSKIKKDDKKPYIRFYENRFNILSELFDWRLIFINKNQWNDNTDKQAFLKEKFGYNMEDIGNLKIKIINKNEKNCNLSINDSKGNIKESKILNNYEKKPKYNLTMQILSKKNK